VAWGGRWGGDHGGEWVGVFFFCGGRGGGGGGYLGGFGMVSGKKFPRDPATYILAMHRIDPRKAIRESAKALERRHHSCCPAANTLEQQWRENH